MLKEEEETEKTHLQTVGDLYENVRVCVFHLMHHNAMFLCVCVCVIVCVCVCDCKRQTADKRREGMRFL